MVKRASTPPAVSRRRCQHYRSVVNALLGAIAQQIECAAAGLEAPRTSDVRLLAAERQLDPIYASGD
jgi:hypothetical protein